MKRTLSVLLAVLMVAGIMTSCAKTNDDSSTTQESNEGNTVGMVESDTAATLDIPDKRYDGKELIFLTRDESEWTTIEIFVDKTDSTTDNVSTAVYERNSIIADKYGVTIKEIKKETGAHINAVAKEVKSPSGDFSAISSNTSNVANMSSQGYLWDLNSDQIQYIDTEKPWWDGNMAKGLSIEGHLFFATGDIMTLDNDATFVILFNKNFAKDSKLPNLYDLVKNKEWTLDKFYEFEQLSVHDVNGNGQLDYKEDVCGYAFTESSPNCLLYATGLSVTSKDQDDTPYYNLDVEHADNVADRCKKIFSKDYTMDMLRIVNTEGITMKNVGEICFGENHALFMGECMQCVTRMRVFDVDFGILPFPMYNIEQGEYKSMMHFTGSSVAIPRSIADTSSVSLEMVDSMLEAMAYYSVPTLTVQYYDINLKTRDAKDEQSGPMIDEILAHRVFDLAYYYGWGDVVNQVSSCFTPTSKRSVSSASAKFKNSCRIGIEKTLRQFEKMG